MRSHRQAGFNLSVFPVVADGLALDYFTGWKMNQPMSRNVVIVNELGLHARSAAKIARLAQQANADVWLEKDGEQADAASIIDLLSLGCPQGSTVTVAIGDGRDIDILDALVDLIKHGFGE
jgi:phosphocarrier protein HPr